MAFRLGIYIFKALLANEPHMDKTPTLAEKGRQARRRNVRNQHPGPRSYPRAAHSTPFHATPHARLLPPGWPRNFARLRHYPSPWPGIFLRLSHD